MDQCEKIWKEALQSYKDTLPAKRVNQILLTPDLDSLLERTEVLRSRYSSRPIIRALNRAQPFLDTIQSFSEVVKVFLQFDPGIFALIWGSICFVLELSARHARVLSRIVDAFDAFYRALPRFCNYTQLVELAGAKVSPLRKALVEYYAEVIGVCQDAVSFCTQRSLSNLLVKPFDSSYEEKTRIRIKRLKTSSAWVDQEANVINHQSLHEGLHLILDELKLVRGHQPTMILLEYPFHNLPHARNPQFHARHTELSRLKAYLRPGVLPEALLVLGLHGTGGIGKTEIALEYAYRYQRYYDAILWVAAETSAKLSDSFSSLSGEIGIVDQSVQSSHQRCEALKRWLSAASQRSNRPCKWLIIYDNVETSDSLKPFWPTGSYGAVIVTSRNPAVSHPLGGPTAAIEVLPFSASEAQNLLLKFGTDGESAVSREEQSAAEAITGAVGNVPLAVFLTGRYIYSARLSLTQFLTAQPDFERAFLFDEQVHSQSFGNYEQSLDKTWSLGSFTANGNPSLAERAVLLMDMVALLDPDGIPLSLFMPKDHQKMLCEGPDQPDEIPCLERYLDSTFTDVSRLDQAISALIGRSMVARKRGAECISCHRLVQISVLNYMPRDRRVVAFNKLQFHLNGVFPQQGDGEPLHSEWKRCEEFSSQVAALLETYKWVKEDVQSPILLCEVTSRCAWYYFERGDMPIAHQLAADAILICENALFRNNHLGYSAWYVKDQLSHLYNVQASVAYETGRTKDASALHSKIKAMRLANSRKGNLDDDKWLAAADGNLAISSMAEGKPETALPLILSLLKRPDIDANEDVYLNNACVCYILLGDYVNALASLFYAGNIYHKQGQLDEAFNALSKCLRLRQALMPKHSYTGLTLHKLGVVVQEQGDIDTSIEYFREALLILETCENQTGAACRSAFAISKAYGLLADDDDNTLKFEKVGKALKASLNDERAAFLGTDPSEYDRFVGFSHR
ncbi:hypothetical protein BU16DRAFT_618820 [Lophium mytilinum]|uniref:Uncharacterized protein n=1 Tax=Lophium mytilinum TaxID=390894 RepID=A0A6A6QR13_9PEZI|nr:hypothetical protein BU16DRAFT_618820 [Lophium mytilinum]